MGELQLERMVGVDSDVQARLAMSRWFRPGLGPAAGKVNLTPMLHLD